MISLTLQAHPPRLDKMLRTAPKKLGGLVAAIHATGRGPWDDFIPDRDYDVIFWFLLEGGRYASSAAAEEKFGSTPIFELKGTIAAIHNDWFDTVGKEPQDVGPFAVILRRNAYLLISGKPVSGEPDRSNFYIPMPDMSAHELLSDQAQLERDFPGLFQIV